MGNLVDNNTETLIGAKLVGGAPHACLFVPLGDLMDPTSWFNPTEYGNVKLKLTGESGAGAIRVSTVQLRV